MRRLFLDFETYYDRNYSLRWMTPIEYILDNRFEMIMCGIGIDDKPPVLMPREEVIDFLRWIKEPYAAISHNALFDMSILAYRYNIHPSIMVDTMAMARAALVYRIPNGKISLGNLMEFLGLGKKMATIADVEGLHFDDIKRVPDLWMRFGTYNINDVIGCRGIYNHLLQFFSGQELHIMDTVIRMATNMKFVADISKLSVYYSQVIHDKAQLLARFGGEEFKSNVMSNEKFAEELKKRGVDPPTKISKTTGKETYAFAKTDGEFMELLEHEDEEVQALVTARIGHKTTIEETRSRRFISITHSTFNSYGEAWMPVPLKYSGAHTHRLSGDWQLNMQNLSTRKNKQIRSALYAPPGYVILEVDASQIEARLVAWLAGQLDLLEMFRKKIDIYKDFAADIYHITIDQVIYIQRFNGKTCILGLGFGMGDDRLLFTLENGAREAGIEAEYTIGECRQWVNRYRTRFSKITDLWDRCNTALFHMEARNDRAQGWEFGACKIDGLSVILPSGLRLWYYNLHKVKGEYYYQYGRVRKKIYGGKFTENMVQALDRQHCFEAALRVEYYCAKEGIPDMRIALNLHDANVWIVREDQLSVVREIALREMSRSPEWAPDIPLAAEAKVGYNYGELE